MTTHFTGEDPDFGTTTEDMDAIDVYMRQAPAKTPAAQKIQADWKSWYDGLNFVTKMLDSNYDEARSRRNAFWLANSTTADEKANVVNVITTGISTEEMQGKPRPKVDAKTGVVNGAVPKPVKSGSAATTSGAQVTHATIRQGSKGADVKAWQAIIGVSADGNFGPATAAATKKWQSDHGLSADGVVGPKTWSAAIPSSGVASDQAFSPVANPDLIGPTPAPKPKASTTAAKAAATDATNAAKQAPLVDYSTLGQKAQVATASVVGGLDVTKWGWKQWLIALLASGGLAVGGKKLMEHHEKSGARR